MITFISIIFVADSWWLLKWACIQLIGSNMVANRASKNTNESDKNFIKFGESQFFDLVGIRILSSWNIYEQKSRTRVKQWTKRMNFVIRFDWIFIFVIISNAQYFFLLFVVFCASVCCLCCYTAAAIHNLV